MAETTDKKCPRCKRTKPRAEFAKNASAPDGLQTYCAPCKRKVDKAHRRKGNGKVALASKALKKATAKRKSRPVRDLDPIQVAVQALRDANVTAIRTEPDGTLRVTFERVVRL